MWSLDVVVFFFSSRRRHTRFDCDWSSDVCSSDLVGVPRFPVVPSAAHGSPGGGGIRRRPRPVAGHRAIFREAGADRRPAELKMPPRPTRLRSRGRQASTGLARISLRAQVVSHLVKPLAQFITANSNLALAA